MELTWADQIEARGVEKGIAKGFEKGFEKGSERGFQSGLERGIETGLEQAADRLRQTVLRLLAQRFGPVSPKLRKRVEALRTFDELEAIADRILEVQAIGELGLGK